MFCEVIGLMSLVEGNAVVQIDLRDDSVTDKTDADIDVSHCQAEDNSTVSRAPKR
jgi:hypothetical protein